MSTVFIDERGRRHMDPDIKSSGIPIKYISAVDYSGGAIQNCYIEHLYIPSGIPSLTISHCSIGEVHYTGPIIEMDKPEQLFEVI